MRVGLVFALAMTAMAHAEPLHKAQFALIIGVNQGVDPSLPKLRYADDDAARYLELFRSLGARTYLLTRADEDTQRLYPQATAEAVPPVESELRHTLAQLAGDLQQARERKVPTVLYIIYSGHGNVENGEGYIALEDGRLTGKRIAQEILNRLHADEAHLIVDACYSYFLAFGRGPGGKRRPLHAFTQIEEVLPTERVGLLFSTSSARESHEWQAYQAGIFSHEVRSGLYGAADADGDGRVSYREMAAFIARANGAIANERYRPDVYARPPRGKDELADLRAALDRRIELDGKETGHFILEDERGVRLAELNNADGQAVQLWRPAASGLLYMRRAQDDNEVIIPPAPDVIALASLEPQPLRASARGGEALAFGSLFTLPFGATQVSEFAFRPLSPPSEWPDPDRGRRIRIRAGTATLLSGAAIAGVALGLVLKGNAIANSVTATTSEAVANQRNNQVHAYQWTGDALFGLAGAAALTGVTLLLWPNHPLGVSVSSRSAFAWAQWRF
jgi:hypothetical protein